jgi:hypothetical protein
MKRGIILVGLIIFLLIFTLVLAEESTVTNPEELNPSSQTWFDQDGKLKPEVTQDKINDLLTTDPNWYNDHFIAFEGEKKEELFAALDERNQLKLYDLSKNAKDSKELWRALSEENKEKLLESFRSEPNKFNERTKELWETLKGDQMDVYDSTSNQGAASPEQLKQATTKNRNGLIQKLTPEETQKLANNLEVPLELPEDMAGIKMGYVMDEDGNEEFQATEGTEENAKTHRIPITNLPKNIDRITLYSPADMYGTGVSYHDDKGNYAFINDGKSVIQNGGEDNPNQWTVKDHPMLTRGLPEGSNQREMIINFKGDKGTVAIGTPSGYNSGIWGWGKDAEVQVGGRVFKNDQTDKTAIPEGDTRKAFYVDIKAPGVFGLRGVMETKDKDGNPEIRARIVGTNNGVVALGEDKDGGAQIPSTLEGNYDKRSTLRIYEKKLADDRSVKLVEGNFPEGAAEVESLSGKLIEYKQDGTTKTADKVKITKQGLSIDPLSEAEWTPAAETVPRASAAPTISGDRPVSSAATRTAAQLAASARESTGAQPPADTTPTSVNNPFEGWQLQNNNKVDEDDGFQVYHNPNTGKYSTIREGRVIDVYWCGSCNGWLSYENNQ